MKKISLSKWQLFNHYLIAIILSITVGCKVNEQKQDNTDLITIEGELYFKLIEFGSFYGVEDSIIQKFQMELDKIDSDSSSTDQFISDYYKILNANDLIKTPHFKVIIDSIQILQVFIDEKQYRKLKNYNHWILEKENKKVLLKLQGKMINEYIFKCNKILELQKVEGKTQWSK